jgi:hypothetical protein
MKVLAVSHLGLLTLSPFICLGFNNHLNLACFLLTNNFNCYYYLSDRGLCWNNSWRPSLALAETLIISLIFSEACLCPHYHPSVRKLQILFLILIWYYSPTSASFSFLWCNPYISHFDQTFYCSFTYWQPLPTSCNSK